MSTQTTNGVRLSQATGTLESRPSWQMRLACLLFGEVREMRQREADRERIAWELESGIVKSKITDQLATYQLSMAAIHLLRATKAINYVRITVSLPPSLRMKTIQGIRSLLHIAPEQDLLLDSFTVTVQRSSGKTPEDRVNEVRDAIKAHLEGDTDKDACLERILDWYHDASWE